MHLYFAVPALAGKLNTTCREVTGLKPLQGYTACIVATDTAGNSSPFPSQLEFISPDSSPPQMSVSLLWSSIRPVPGLKTCEATFVFTADEAVDVNYMAIDATLEYLPLLPQVYLSNASTVALTKQASNDSLEAALLDPLLDPLSEEELQQVAVHLAGGTADMDGTGQFRMSLSQQDQTLKDASGIHYHLQLSTLPCSQTMRLLAVAEDASGNIGKHAVEVLFATPDTAAPQFLNHTPHAAVDPVYAFSTVSVQLQLSEPCTVSCALMACLPASSIPSTTTPEPCSHVARAQSGSLLHNTVPNSPSSTHMWSMSTNFTDVESVEQVYTLQLQHELVCLSMSMVAVFP